MDFESIILIWAISLEVQSWMRWGIACFPGQLCQNQAKAITGKASLGFPWFGCMIYSQSLSGPQYDANYFPAHHSEALFDCSTRSNYFGMTGWLQVGTVLGVAVDLEQGRMLATACPTSISSASDWHTVFKTGLSPSAEIGSALFPVISGVLGAEVKYNFGHNLATRPMLHSPPSDDYKPISAALFLNGGQVCLAPS